MQIIRFDSLKQARDWYDSPSYRELRKIRQRSGNTRAVIIEGTPP